MSKMLSVRNIIKPVHSYEEAQEKDVLDVTECISTKTVGSYSRKCEKMLRTAEKPPHMHFKNLYLKNQY